MKKLNLLFVLCFVFIVKSNAQQFNDTRLEMHDGTISLAGTTEVESKKNNLENEKIKLTKKEIESLKLNEQGSNQTLKVSKDASVLILKTAEPSKRKSIEGNRAEITNQPLKKYNEDLVPVKVK